jgi:salicylate hydroxylase
MKIIIAGGGIGGLCAALALARAGFHPEVIEQAGKLTEIGAGIQISPNATKVLRTLGLEDEFAQVASRPEALEMWLGRSGVRVFSVPMGAAGEKRYGAPYLHVHRADLVSVLHAAALKAGAGVRLDGRVVTYMSEGDKVRCGLDTGEIVDADILVGADGIHSAVRHAMLGEEAPRFTGSVAWRALAPARAGVGLPESAIVWAGRNQHAVTYRVRRGELINFVGVVEQQDWRGESWRERGDKEELRELFRGWAAPVTSVIQAAEHVYRWALFDRDPLPRWTDGRVTLLGDACHPMPPFQAQGAAMAIEDAFVLARCLLELHNRPQEALRLYEDLRKPRTTKVLRSARSNMHLFHRSNFLTQTATYAPMRVADMLAPAYVRSRQDWIYGYDATQAL